MVVFVMAAIINSATVDSHEIQYMLSLITVILNRAILGMVYSPVAVLIMQGIMMESLSKCMGFLMASYLMPVRFIMGKSL